MEMRNRVKDICFRKRNVIRFIRLFQSFITIIVEDEEKKIRIPVQRFAYAFYVVTEFTIVFFFPPNRVS